MSKTPVNLAQILATCNIRKKPNQLDTALTPPPSPVRSEPPPKSRPALVEIDPIVTSFAPIKDLQVLSSAEAIELYHSAMALAALEAEKQNRKGLCQLLELIVKLRDVEGDRHTAIFTSERNNHVAFRNMVNRNLSTLASGGKITVCRDLATAMHREGVRLKTCAPAGWKAPRDPIIARKASPIASTRSRRQTHDNATEKKRQQVLAAIRGIFESSRQ